jgi:DNA polymerase V
MRRVDSERHLRLMEAVDRINRRHGRHTVRTLAMGQDRAWDMRRGRLSGRYTTRLGEVLKVKAY